MKECTRITMVTLITISLFFGLIGSAYSGNTLLVVPKSKDFGVLDEGVSAQLLVTLTNTGDRDINITNVRTN